MMKKIHFVLIFVSVLLLFCTNAMAHKVNLFAYAEGGKVFTESYFPDGRPVEKGKVLVFDSQNKKLLEGITDEKGLFSFTIPKMDDLNIVIEASMGHKNNYKLKKAEVEAGK